MSSFAFLLVSVLVIVAQAADPSTSETTTAGIAASPTTVETASTTKTYGRCNRTSGPRYINIDSNSAKADQERRIEFVHYDSELVKPVAQDDGSVHPSQNQDQNDQEVHPLIIVGNESYAFHHLHFHWTEDREDDTNKHSVDGKTYDLEIHFAHYNVKYNSTENAQHYEDGIAILAIFLTIRGENNLEYDSLIAVLRETQLESQNDTVRREALHLSALVSENSLYYQYRSKSQTLECNESGLWVIQKEPATISEEQSEQIKKFKKQQKRQRRMARSPKTYTSPGVPVYVMKVKQ